MVRVTVKIPATLCDYGSCLKVPFYSFNEGIVYIHSAMETFNPGIDYIKQ